MRLIVALVGILCSCVEPEYSEVQSASQVDDAPYCLGLDPVNPLNQYIGAEMVAFNFCAANPDIAECFGHVMFGLCDQSPNGCDQPYCGADIQLLEKCVAAIPPLGDIPGGCIERLWRSY